MRAQLLDGAGAEGVARDERNLSASLNTHMAARREESKYSDAACSFVNEV